MKKFLIAAIALALIATPAMAKKNKNHNYWQGKNHNYWPSKKMYWGGGVYFNNPSWGGGFYGGSYNYYNYNRNYYNNNYWRGSPNCRIVYAPRCVQGLGCQPVEEYVCN